jgi:hypothetical protein
VVALGVLGEELVIGPEGVLQPAPGRPAPPLVEDVVPQGVLGAGRQVAGGQGRVAVAPVGLLQQPRRQAGVEQRPGRTGGEAQRRLRLFDGEAARRGVAAENFEDAELHGGHDGAGDPEAEEQLEHVVGVRG